MDKYIQHRLGQHYTKEERLITKYNEQLLNVEAIVDPFCGEGHLLEHYLNLFEFNVAKQKLEYMNVMGFDISYTNVKTVQNNLIKKYNCSKSLVNKIVKQRDSLNKDSIPDDFFVFTNPPYLSKTICKRKFKNDFEQFFCGENAKYNDYYEIALQRYGQHNGLWIVPANLLSSDIMQNIRQRIIHNMFDIHIHEEKTFSDTGISIITFVINHNNSGNNKTIVFNRYIGNRTIQVKISADGNLCEEWEAIKSIPNTNKVSQGYIDTKINHGNNEITVLDTQYNPTVISVDDDDYKKLKNNILFLRTTDTGTKGGRIGLFTMKEMWDSDAENLITKISSRIYTPIFFNNMPEKEQLYIQKEFNQQLETLRKKYNSIFLTNFKNSANSEQRKRITFKEVFSLINKIINEGKYDYSFGEPGPNDLFEMG